MSNRQSCRRHLDDFIQGRIILKSVECQTVTSVAKEFVSRRSIASQAWRAFQMTGEAAQWFCSGCPRATTAADDPYLVLHSKRDRRKEAREIDKHVQRPVERSISNLTGDRRFDKGGLFTRRPVRCVPLKPAHLRRRFLRCQEHRTVQICNDLECSLQMRAALI